ncbi:hypothetical protein [Nocardioides zeae]|uniref:Uncharacterized protein n=1 Tax=Nocardioides zeae TaxID=1457234 RepID=A0A6P0HIV8_9ACTN|nr:hypothetical protein [Nocardioides zeae]NEN77565.1 hypothetical protein [Nocardioides zeae]
MPTDPPDDTSSQPGHDLQRALFDLFRDAEVEPETRPETERVTDDTPDGDPVVVRDPFPEAPEAGPPRTLAERLAARQATLRPVGPLVDPEPEPEPGPEPEEPTAGRTSGTTVATASADLYPAPEPEAETAPLAALLGPPADDPADGSVLATPAPRTADDDATRRPWLLPLIGVAVISVVVAIGGVLTLGGDDEAPPRSTSTEEPSATPTASDVEALLASSQALYDEVSDAVTATADLAGLPAAVAVAEDARAEAEALVAQAGTLDPAPTQPQLDVVTRQRDLVAAVAAFAALDTATLASFGELATVLRGAADLLAQAEAGLELAERDGDAAAAGAQLDAVPDDLVLAAARPRAVPAPPTSTAQHLVGLVGTAAIRATTEDLTEIAGRLEGSTRTAEVREAAADAAALAAYAQAARAGFDDDSETAVALDRLLALLGPVGRLTELDGENLDLWSDVSADLADATDGDDQLGAATRAAYAHLDALVAAARSTIAAWEAEVAQQEGSSEDAAEVAAYASAMSGVFSTYDALAAQTPRLAAGDTPSSSVGSALFRLRGPYASLEQRVRGITAPGSLQSAHASVVALAAAAEQAVTRGEAVSREGEQCISRGGSPAGCRLGKQPTWASYSSSLGAVAGAGTVRSAWSAALAEAQQAAPAGTPPPRPDV